MIYRNIIKIQFLFSRPPVDMTGSPLLPPEVKKPKVDKITRMKQKCYTALMKDMFFKH